MAWFWALDTHNKNYNFVILLPLKNLTTLMAGVVAQLAKKSLLSSEIRGSNPTIEKLKFLS